jgi:uncharacterized protein YbjT (DUF2867 family)
VAQTPTKVMKDYQRCRAEGEASVRAIQVPTTFLRPWYVVGPGHYWPLLLKPVFTLLEWIPATAQKAKALRLVTLKQMLQALCIAIDKQPKEVRVVEIEGIRNM